MTRQALNQLIATMQAAPEVRFIRASASQMAGRLLCEFDAPDQDTLLRVLDTHLVTYEWIIREELSWGDRRQEESSTADTSDSTAPQSSAPAPQEAPQDIMPGAPEAPSEAAVTEHSRPSTETPDEPGEATILHILRALKDESAWQIIRLQRQTHPVAVLLIHDAVLAPPPLEVPMYACEADVLARGIISPLPRLTYAQIVELIFACKQVMVW
jgi:sulfur transfer complex TusBCD TusB component (DsrH family)